MIAFSYQAVDTAGRTRHGQLRASDAQAATAQLLGKRWLVLQLAPAAAEPGRPVRLPARELALFTRQLAALTASLPLAQALQAISQQAGQRRLRQAVQSTQTRLAEGFALAEAMAAQPRAFPPLYRAMIAAGEASGALPQLLARLADLLEQQQQVRARLATALIYPATLALTACAVVIALMTLVVPRVVEQFDAMGRQLPLLTRIVVGSSELLATLAPWLGAALLALLLAAPLALRRPGLRLAVDRLILRLPLAGNLLRQVHAAQLARTLAIMLAAGLPLIDGLRASARTIANTVLRNATAQMATVIDEGGSLSTAMRLAAVFPSTLLHMTSSGEDSGQLAPMLESAADYLERQSQTTTQVAMGLLEPLIIIALGVVVGVIVLAILLPILQFNSLVLG